MKTIRHISDVIGLLFLVSGRCRAFTPTHIGPLTFSARSLLGSTANLILKKPHSPDLGRVGQKKQPVLHVATTASPLEETKVESSGESLSSKLFKVYVSTMRKATNLFPIWTILFSMIALNRPHSFDWFTTLYFTEALEILVLSMGLTLTPQDFVNVLKRPKAVILQFFNCFAVMPLLAYALGMGFGLDQALLAGMVLVGSINGAQASNLCTYIAKGNVALSVVMTTLSTVGTIVMTPLLCKSLLGTIVPVDAYGIARSTVTVVLAPLAVGMTLKKCVPKFVKLILPLAPLVGVFATCLLVSSAVAQVAEPILGAGLTLQVSNNSLYNDK
jgi:BASS family bile acid:Na+ symporter